MELGSLLNLRSHELRKGSSLLMILPYNLEDTFLVQFPLITSMALVINGHPASA